MTENNKKSSKNKWKQLIQKKWFFPAVYLMIAAMLLTGIVWYQNISKQTEVKQDDHLLDGLINEQQLQDDGEVKAVMDQKETIKMPVSEEEPVEIVMKFFDYDAEQADQERALIEYNNRYYQSTGVGFAKEDGEPFEVIASLSGEVTEVKDDPILGNVVILSHDDDIMTYYASLNSVEVEVGDELAQGDLIGTAGNNLFAQEHGTHVHFELRKDGEEVNPEEFFNEPISLLADYQAAEDIPDETDEEPELDEADEEDEEDDDEDPLPNDADNSDEPSDD